MFAAVLGLFAVRIPVHAATAPKKLTAQQIYEKIRANRKRLFPDSFTARFSERSMNANLANLPAEAVVRGKKARVTLYYKKPDRTALVLTGVTAEFLPFYEPLLEGYRPIVAAAVRADLDKNWAEFTRDAVLTYAGDFSYEKERYHRLRYRPKHVRDGSHAIIVVRESDWTVARIISRDKGAPEITAFLNYKKVGKYILPSAVRLVGGVFGDKKSGGTLIKLEGHRVNAPIPDSVFRKKSKKKRGK